MYEYKETGMDNVWLVNGHTVVEGPDGAAVQVVSVRQLANALAQVLVQSEAALSGRALRFLRLQLGLERTEMGAIIGVGAETIIQWEQEVTVLPVAADFMARVVYASRLTPSVTAVALLEQMAHVKRGTRHRIVCRFEQDAWRVGEE
ncbi:MAG: hypothetical protein KBC57_03085 [Neisseriaceae bacterium]|nr:hypothetical protein [Neisseriaceae bacterium]MBP6861323.1 hypothetical protein [Neisseriaceae bacterium]